MNWNISHSFDLSSGHPTPPYLSNVLAEVGDNLSHNWSVVITENGQPVNLNGATVVGYFIRADGGKVPVNGEAQGCVATVIPEAACFAIAGMLKCVMKITLDGATTTVDAFMINVRGDLTDVVVDPGDVVPDLQSLLDAIDDMEEATAAAEAAAEIAMPSIEYMGMANLSGINWTLRKNISNGQETGSQYTALSGFIPAAPTYTRTGADTDSNNVPLSMFVHEYDSTQTWLRRTAINASAGKTMHPQSDCAYVRIVFGRASSSGVEISQSDIDDYFGIDALVAVQDEIADTRKDVTEFKNALDTTSVTWALNGINVSTGANTTATNRISSGFVTNCPSIVRIAEGYSYMIMRYAKDGTYDGAFDGSEWSKSYKAAMWRTTVLTIDDLGETAGNYNYRVAMKANGDADLTIADAEHITLFTVSDNTLTMTGKAADAKAVSDAIAILTDVESLTVSGTLNAKMDDTAITGASYGRIVYVALPSGALRVKVTKNAGKTFRVGFTESIPANHSVISGSVLNGLATMIEANVPNGATYLAVYYWNTNTDTGSESDMLASVTMTAIIGAKDATAREGVATNAEAISGLVQDVAGLNNTKVDNFLSVEFDNANKRIACGHSTLPDGTFVTASGFYVTDYIGCTEGVKVSFYGQDFYWSGSYASYVIAFYDANKAFISGVYHVGESAGTSSSVGIAEATAPANTAYVAFCTNGLVNGCYARVCSITPDGIALKSDLSEIYADIELLKNGKIVVAGEDIISGSYSSTGAVVANSARIRFAKFMPVNAGDVLHFVPGTKAAQMLFGTFRTDYSFVRDSSWYTSNVQINIEADGYIIAVYRTDSSNPNIDPSDYDATTELIKYFAADTDTSVNLDNWRKYNNNARHIQNNAATPLTLLHFSDLHEDKAALKRITDYAKNITGIDGMICTGDMVGNSASQIDSWWDADVMTCIGNHDAASYSEGVYDWDALSMANRDAYYIAPFESNWGIVHTSGKSYYYKDYTTQNVRLIVMDSQCYIANGSDATDQTAWLESLLASAKTAGLHVLIAIHAPYNNAPVVACSFSRYGAANMATLTDSFTPQAVVDAVSAAITAGTKFIGYIVGHNHQDYVYSPATGQLGYCITCANVTSRPQWASSDQFRDSASDAVNLVTIDTVNTLVKIIRIGGADLDNKMRTRKGISFNYATSEKVGEML